MATAHRTTPYPIVCYQRQSVQEDDNQSLLQAFIQECPIGDIQWSYDQDGNVTVQTAEGVWASVHIGTWILKHPWDRYWIVKTDQEFEADYEVV